MCHTRIRKTVWQVWQWTQKASVAPARASLIVMDGNLRYILANSCLLYTSDAADE